MGALRPAPEGPGPGESLLGIEPYPVHAGGVGVLGGGGVEAPRCPPTEPPPTERPRGLMREHLGPRSCLPCPETDRLGVRRPAGKSHWPRHRRGGTVARLFCFGLGFSARRLAQESISRAWAVAGTCRTPERRAELAAAGIEAAGHRGAGHRGSGLRRGAAVGRRACGIRRRHPSPELRAPRRRRRPGPGAPRR